MKEEEIIERIRLINTDNVGPIGFYKLIRQYGSAAEALQVLSTQKKVFSRAKAETELEKARRLNVKIIMRGDEDYPEALNRLNDAPPVLYARGQSKLLNYPATISVVGSRSASVNGRKIASKIAFDLTQSDVLIISGMARGIDSAAHKGALYAKEQKGATIAVLGTGVDVPYPSENAALYEQICAQGLVISEYMLGTGPQPTNFPRRNRIVSALGSGVLVVEASLNSGSLITARLGLEQGKDVFAVPGSPLDGHAAGTNKLIREGAYLTESAEDILECLSFTQQKQIKDYVTPDLFTAPLDKPQKNTDIHIKNNEDEASSLISIIPTDGIETDELIRRCALSASEAMMQITELELDGKIERLGSRLFPKR